MNKIVHLSLTKKDVPIRIDVVQYATTPSIVFVLDDYTPGSGATANLYIKKPDGTEIYNSCTISGNQVTYDPTTQSFASLGTSKCQLQIIESGDTAVSFLIYADVTENIIDSSAIESQDEFTALEEALREVGQFVKHDDTGGNVSLNGNLTLNKETPTISLLNSETNGRSLLVAQPVSGADGNNFLLQAGGNFIAGGGEYPTSRYNATLDGDTREDTYIGADQNVYIETGGQTIANAKRWTFDTTGKIISPTDTTVLLGDSQTTKIEIWSNASNKVGIEAGNNAENKSYELLAKEDRLRLYNDTDATTIWDILPATVVAYGSDMGQDTVSLPNNTWTEVGSYTFSAGIYLIDAIVKFASNANGIRNINFQNVSAASGGWVINNCSADAVNGDATFCTISTMVSATTTQTFYLNAKQNSGGALNCNPRWHCVKIG